MYEVNTAAPVEIKKEIQRKIIGDEQPTIVPLTHQACLKEYRRQLRDMEQEEDVLSYALFPQVAEQYFKYLTEKYGIGVHREITPIRFIQSE